MIYAFQTLLEDPEDVDVRELLLEFGIGDDPFVGVRNCSQKSMQTTPKML